MRTYQEIVDFVYGPNEEADVDEIISRREHLTREELGLLDGKERSWFLGHFCGNCDKLMPTNKHYYCDECEQGIT